MKKWLEIWRRMRREESVGDDIQDEFTYEGFGFTVILLNVHMQEYNGVRTFALKQAIFERLVAGELIARDAPYTGNHVHYLRSFLDLRIGDAARLFNTKQSDWLDWETKRREPAGIPERVEGDLRIEITRYLQDFDDSSCTTSVYLGGDSTAARGPLYS